ncbi:c-type cytochrome [Bacteriovoracaceae bacterium]|nr:c-type cytochrome [Bacteriovoracaceae bacterium]
MTRVLVFLAFVVGLVAIMNLRNFEDIKIDNTKFDFEKRKATNLKKKKEIADLMAPKEEEVVVEVKKEGPLVVLSTEQLVRGEALYKKCIVCHGKRGDGKKSQKSPAIGGQHDWYIESQINNMISGVRVNKIMNPYIRKLSPQDVKDLSVYISMLPAMGK